jgi:ABC-type Mn2+/Zn2+ transport system ATPase subunit
MVSHDIDRVRRLAERVTLLDRRVVAEGSPDSVLDARSAFSETRPGRARQATR